jgi:hypothetical protein
MKRRELLKTAATLPILSVDLSRDLTDRYPERIGDFTRDGYFETVDKDRMRVEYVHTEHAYEHLFIKIHRPSDAFEVHSHGCLNASWGFQNESECKHMLFKLCRETTALKQS